MFNAKETLKNIEPYSVDKYYPECELKLDSNENVFGPSKRVIEAFKNLDLRRFNLYPCYGELIGILASRFGFAPDNFLLTNGCDEAINIILSAYLTENDSVLAFCPSFSMPKLYSKIIGAKYLNINYVDKWKFSISALMDVLKPDVKIIYLASPNNPTGDIIEPSIIEEVLQKCTDRIILLDLTYVNYSRFNEAQYYPLVKKYKNLICVKSFSKDYALAGLRLGFILSNPEFIVEFKKIISPYSVNSMAVYAGIQALLDTEHFEYVKSEVQKSKEFLFNEFEKMGQKYGFVPYKSEANFILVDFKKKAEFVYRKLYRAGIIVRKFSNPEMSGFLRISIPPLDGAKKIVEALKERDMLVFDLDGVVFDVSNSYRFAIQKTFEHFAGCECSASDMQEAKNLGGLSNDWDLTKYLLDKKGVKADYSKLVEIFQGIFYNPEKEGSKGAIDNEEIVLDEKFFNELSKYYDLAVFTGRPREEAFYSLEKFGIKQFFDYFVCLEDVPAGRSKPCPDGLEKIKECCYYDKISFFGDTVDDIKAGRSASVDVYGVIPPNAANVEDTTDLLKQCGAKGVIDGAYKILELFGKENTVCK